MRAPVLIPIGMLAKAAATTVDAIQYYEQIGLIPAPQRSPAYSRAYGPEHVRRVMFIERGLELGFTFGQLRRLLVLADRPDGDCEAIDQVARECRTDMDRKIANLKALASELDRLIGRCGHGRVEECEIVQTLCSLR